MIGRVPPTRAGKVRPDRSVRACAGASQAALSVGVGLIGGNDLARSGYQNLPKLDMVETVNPQNLRRTIKTQNLRLGRKFPPVAETVRPKKHRRAAPLQRRFFLVVRQFENDGS